MAWIDEIIKAYEHLGGIAPYSEIYNFIKKNTSRDLPSSWKAIIRKIVEDYSSDSENFKGKSSTKEQRLAKSGFNFSFNADDPVAIIKIFL